MNLGMLLRFDIFYKNKKGEYELGPNNEFTENNLNKIVDHYALGQAINKFTRDIFGPRRLMAVLKKVPNYKNIRSDMKKFGLKMDSEDPNMHRRVAYFFYWFSVYKPFHITKGADTKKNTIIPKRHQFIIECFNEFITYSLMQMALSSCIIRHCPMAECKNKKAGLEEGDCSLTINLDKNENMFEIFLSRLHSNKLNRSSLELLLSNSYIFSKCKKTEEPCPLQKHGFHKWRTFE